MAYSQQQAKNVNDPNFQEWLEDAMSDSGSDQDFDPDLESDHESNSELDYESDNNPQDEAEPGISSEILEDNQENIGSEGMTCLNYFGKNRFKWCSISPDTNVRTRSHNIIVHLPGVIGPAKLLGKSCTELASWTCIFTNNILDEVLLCSNKKMETIRNNFSDNCKYLAADIDLVELKAFLGLLFFTAIFKSNDEDLSSIFATDGTGREIFRCSMSEKRFAIILAALRFDDSCSRQERTKTDPTAAISNLFSLFLKNCKENYSISDQACIDEMLIGFRGRCRFRMYIPNKPRKYGIKILAINDAKTHYFLDGYIYAGKGSDGTTLSEEEKKLSKPTQAVIRLAKSIEGTNRNITADNWFSSIEVVRELKKRGLTYVGTLKKNKKEIPKEFLPAKSRKSGTSIFGFGENMTLVSYVPKPRKAVILVSSMHHSASINDETGKPEIIHYYNATKGGVDALDEKCTVYSTNRRSRRWPLTVFYAMLNISLVNSFVIYSSMPENKQISRFDFIKNLARQLVEPQLQRRVTNLHIPRDLRLSISRLINYQIPKPLNVPGKRIRCGKCPRNRDKKTKVYCAHCSTPICTDCTKSVCEDCL